MAKFVLKLVSFLLVLFAILGGSVGLALFASKQNLESCHLGAQYDSLLMGDSHTMWAIDDSSIQGLKNVSLNAEGYKYSYKKLKYYLESGYRPKKIYIGFSYHNLSGYYDKYISGSLFLHFFDRYLPIMDTQDLVQVLITNPDELSHIFKKVMRVGAKSALKPGCNLHKGFPSKEMTQVYEPEAMLRRVDAQFYSEGSLIGPSLSNQAYLSELIRLCRSIGAEVVLVNTPLHEEYLELVPPEYVKIYDSFIEENRLNVYEFSELELSNNHFLPDGDHINSKGAALVTEAFRDYHETH